MGRREGRGRLAARGGEGPPAPSHLFSQRAVEPAVELRGALRGRHPRARRAQLRHLGGHAKTRSTSGRPEACCGGHGTHETALRAG